MKTWRPELVLALAVFVLCGAAAIEAPLDAGVALYRKCTSAEVDVAANPETIDEAIVALTKGLNDPATEEAAAAWLLRALYLKGTYAAHGAKEKKEVFRTGVDLGERMAEKYPQSGPIQYGLALCWGRWGEAYGILAAARKGVADRIREAAEAAAELGPEDTTADAYRLLGRLHHQAPRIPFILKWPSDDKAIALLRQSEALRPNIPGTYYFLGDVLIEEGRDDEALPVLKRGQACEPRPHERLEDVAYIAKCAELLAKLEN